MREISYGVAGFDSYPLIDAGAQDYLTTIPTIAAGDVKITTDRQPATNPLAKILGFDSMSEIPRPGDVLDENGAGTATCVVIAVVLDSGTVGTTGGGFMFVESVSGEAWADNDQIDNTTTGTADVATVDAGTTGVYTLATNQIANTAGLLAFANDRGYVAWTSAEAQCEWMDVDIKDSATKEWEDTGGSYLSTDHPRAHYPKGAVYGGVLDATTDVAADGTTIALPDQTTAERTECPQNATANQLVGWWCQAWNDVGVQDGAYIASDSVASNIRTCTFVANKGLNFNLQTSATEVQYRLYPEKPQFTGDAFARIGAAGASLTDLGGMSTGMKAEVQTEANDALVANNLDHLALTATGAADMTTEVADNTILSRVLSNGDTSAFVPSTDGLQPIRDNTGTAGVGLTSVGIAAANYSGVTVRVHPMNYSGMTVAVDDIAPTSYSGVTVGIDNIAPASLLSMSISTGGTRYVQDAFAAMRNRVDLTSSTITVYAGDDASVAWSGTVTRSQMSAVQTINPA